jgi:hypothetical protein
VRRGSHSAASSGAARSAGTPEYVIEIGHRCPPSAWPIVMNAAARATCAPGRDSVQGSEWRPWETEASMSLCHAGWNSTSSMRWP